MIVPQKTKCRPVILVIMQAVMHAVMPLESLTSWCPFAWNLSCLNLTHYPKLQIIKWAAT